MSPSRAHVERAHDRLVVTVPPPRWLRWQTAVAAVVCGAVPLVVAASVGLPGLLSPLLVAVLLPMISGAGLAVALASRHRGSLPPELMTGAAVGSGLAGLLLLLAGLAVHGRVAPALVATGTSLIASSALWDVLRWLQGRPRGVVVTVDELILVHAGHRAHHPFGEVRDVVVDGASVVVTLASGRELELGPWPDELVAWTLASDLRHAVEREGHTFARELPPPPPELLELTSRAQRRVHHGADRPLGPRDGARRASVEPASRCAADTTAPVD